ncbi:hypothetical protein [Streptomyces milbemycinicus]|uniref:hypothetical protein n=1 Tax=Streptomyces milbemycinicus TaxID=476552 RepID=UPI0021F912C7|nr:hypothetical protein [Streptomyces milbemycinicus]
MVRVVGCQGLRRGGQSASGQGAGRVTVGAAPGTGAWVETGQQDSDVDMGRCRRRQIEMRAQAEIRPAGPHVVPSGEGHPARRAAVHLDLRDEQRTRDGSRDVRDDLDLDLAARTERAGGPGDRVLGGVDEPRRVAAPVVRPRAPGDDPAAGHGCVACREGVAVPPSEQRARVDGRTYQAPLQGRAEFTQGRPVQPGAVRRVVDQPQDVLQVACRARWLWCRAPPLDQRAESGPVLFDEFGHAVVGLVTEVVEQLLAPGG